MYYPLLDLLRFIASVAVMFHHYFEKSGDPFSVYGYLGVPLFFIISGFVIYISSKDGEIKEYAISRFVRIFPLFWFACTITYIATLILAIHPLPFKTFLLNLLIIGNWIVIPPIDNSYWTLPFELIFYIAFGFFFFFFTKRNALWFFAGWIVFSYLVFFFKLQDLLIAKLTMVRFAPYFSFGGLLAIIVERSKVMSLIEGYVAYFFLLLAGALPIIIHVSLGNTRPNYLGTPLTLTALVITYSFFLLIPAAVYLNRFCTNERFVRILQILGGITYPLYLLHQKIGEVIVLRAGYPVGYTPIFLFCLPLCLSSFLIS